jgi:drug/metabolite transporter (DMT)-like permease
VARPDSPQYLLAPITRTLETMSTAAPPRPARPLLTPGVRWMAAGAFWFSLMSLLVKVAGQRLPVMEIVLVRAVVTLALSWWMIRRLDVHPWGVHHGRLILRGVFGFLALSCFYYGVIHLPLAEATVIQYMNPVWTALLAAWLLRERMGPREIACVLAGLAGVVVIARPGFLFGAVAAGLDPLVVGIALMGSLGSAAAYTTVRSLSGREHPMVIVFFFPLVTVPLALPLALRVWTWPTPLEWLVLLGVGVTTQMGQVAITRGLSMERAGKATAVGYLQIVFAATWGALFFLELPDGWTLAGAALIVASTLALAHGSRVAAPAADDAEALPSLPSIPRRRP